MEKIDRRLEILEVASRLFKTFGYKKTTLDDVAKEVGLGKTALYHYFQSKEDIFRAVIGGNMSESIEMGKTALYSSDDIRTCLSSYVEQAISHNRAMHKANYVILGELKDFLPVIRDIIADYMRTRIEIVKQKLSEAIADGRLKPLDVQAYALLLHIFDVEPDVTILLEDMYKGGFPSSVEIVDALFGSYFIQDAETDMVKQRDNSGRIDAR